MLKTKKKTRKFTKKESERENHSNRRRENLQPAWGGRDQIGGKKKIKWKKGRK